jgi:hypothetical protein
MDDLLVPDIDENIPLPANAAEAMPNLSPFEELDMRARTVKLISDLTGIPVIPDESDEESAHSLAKAMIEDPQTKPDFAKYPNETIALYAGMAARYNHMIVEELADLKLYVVNKLFETVETAKDDKSRIAALTKLGEVDGVDAFKKKSELTIKVKPLEEVEKELLTVLEGIEYRVIGTKMPELVTEITEDEVEEGEFEEDSEQNA